MTRPTKSEAIVIQKRNKEILEMEKKGYPRDYICNYFGLSKGRLSLILKKIKRNN
jgi:hypothetical protein